mmetsp:Transcript_29197/g.41087  ORF Transcript_29197/g.41087 Transcript_29197/m.41087 type:complete len:126 (+) Transcript_29197:2047-2424(+)
MIFCHRSLPMTLLSELALKTPFVIRLSPAWNLRLKRDPKLVIFLFCKNPLYILLFRLYLTFMKTYPSHQPKALWYEGLPNRAQQAKVTLLVYHHFMLCQISILIWISPSQELELVWASLCGFLAQ